ncbi:homoserine O-acetyltransferase, partial [Mesorhizobium sp. M2D.F.Ca.ET.145.01.1.1]
MAALRAARTNNEVDNPSSLVLRFGPDKPLKLDAGTVLSPFQIAYQTYGVLNDARSN